MQNNIYTGSKWDNMIEIECGDTKINIYGNARLSDMHIQNTHHFSNAQIVYGDKVIDILQKEDVSHGETTRVKNIIWNSCQNNCRYNLRMNPFYVIIKFCTTIAF